MKEILCWRLDARCQMLDARCQMLVCTVVPTSNIYGKSEKSVADRSRVKAQGLHPLGSRTRYIIAGTALASSIQL